MPTNFPSKNSRQDKTLTNLLHEALIERAGEVIVEFSEVPTQVVSGPRRLRIDDDMRRAVKTHTSAFTNP